MLFHCPRVRANFAAERLCLVNHDQARLLWDEHGGTFVLRVEGLEVAEATEAQEEAGIWLEMALPAAAALAHRIEGFAGRHCLQLSEVTAPAVMAETPILVACHIPGKQLFIYCEAPQVTMRFSGGPSLELQISGAFKARRLPCQATDLVIHLEMAAVCRLLAGMLAWARKGA